MYLVLILTRTVANYIVWRYVARLPNALPERVRDIQTKYRKVSKS